MKGILFKPESIQAIVDLRKTQTRRVIKPQPVYGDYWQPTEDTRQYFYCSVDAPAPKCHKPRYQVGETVYIKEAWAVKSFFDVYPPSELPLSPELYYKLDYPEPHGDYNDPESGIPLAIGRWRSPLFMPEWAARYFIVIESVRAERLQEITEADCLAEGITIMRGTYQSIKWNEATRRLEPTGKRLPYTACYHFEAIWNSINKDYPFESNPWVFAYTFRLKENK